MSTLTSESVLASNIVLVFSVVRTATNLVELLFISRVLVKATANALHSTVNTWISIRTIFTPTLTMPDLHSASLPLKLERNSPSGMRMREPLDTRSSWRQTRDRWRSDLKLETRLLLRESSSRWRCLLSLHRVDTVWCHSLMRRSSMHVA